MFLAVDIGNTNIKMGLFKDNKIVHIFRLNTNKNISPGQNQSLIKRLFAQGKFKDIEQTIICSVVPRLNGIFQKALFSVLKKRPLILGKDIIVPIKNLYIKPEQVGQDRLANALAAFTKYGGPAIVVDFGTAVTFDLVSEKGGYLGGIIVPGIEISLKALTGNAELLPEIRLAKPRTFLGRDTISSMKSGIVYGYAFLVEGILQRLKDILKKRPYIVATGGEAPLISCYCKYFDKIDMNLTLEGIKLVFERNFKKK